MELVYEAYHRDEAIMATSTYQGALEIAVALPRDEKLRLIEELASRLREEPAPEPKRKRSIMELRGLGKEIWQGIDAQKFIDEERTSWEREWDR